MAMILKADILSLEALADLKLELATDDKAPGEVLIRLILGHDDEVHVRLGSHFLLDGDLAERLADVEGIENVALEPLRGRVKLKRVA